MHHLDGQPGDRTDHRLTYQLLRVSRRRDRAGDARRPPLRLGAGWRPARLANGRVLEPAAVSTRSLVHGNAAIWLAENRAVWGQFPVCKDSQHHGGDLRVAGRVGRGGRSTAGGLQESRVKGKPGGVPTMIPCLPSCLCPASTAESLSSDFAGAVISWRDGRPQSFNTGPREAARSRSRQLPSGLLGSGPSSNPCPSCKCHW